MIDFDYDFIDWVTVPCRPLRPAYDTFNATKRPGHGANDRYPTVIPAPVVAAGTGKIRFTGMGSTKAGGLVEILCPTDPGWFLLRTMHQEYLFLPVGTPIEQGEVIGEIAHSSSPRMGNANAPHSHGEIKWSPDPDADQWTMYGGNWGTRLDPEKFNIYDENEVPPVLAEILIDRPLLEINQPPYRKDMAVQELQYLLAVRDFIDTTPGVNLDPVSGTFDGKFGPSTEQGVKDYQISTGLVTDGKVGSATWTVLLDY